MTENCTKFISLRQAMPAPTKQSFREHHVEIADRNAARVKEAQDSIEADRANDDPACKPLQVGIVS